MTIELRDYFAGKALQGLLANAHLQKEFLKDLDKIEKSMQVEFSQGKKAEYMQHQHALISYAFADAMLKRKDKCK